MRIIFEAIFIILALLMLLNGEYEMSALACISAGIVRIEDKLENGK